MITVTFLRHGESTDNLRNVWAGWADAPLSNHGMNQARALGESFRSTRITEIIASPLKRAHATAKQISELHDEPKPQITLSDLLKEQYFGVAEGHGFLPPKKSAGKVETEKWYEPMYGRDDRFPDGESMNDVAKRGSEVIDKFIVPHVLNAKGKTAEGTHIVFVSHGICIAETIGALMRKSTHPDANVSSWLGLMNTAWTRCIIGVQGEESLQGTPQDIGSLVSIDSSATDTGAKVATALHSQNLPETTTEPRPLLTVNITAVNQRSHLEGLKRQQGKIGSAAYDENQKAITDFFGGGGRKSPAASSL